MRRWLVCVSVAMLLCSAPRGARAEPPAPTKAGVDEARGHFQRGIRAYKAGDFRSALLSFQEAYKASPNYRVLYNIGRSYGELQDFASAIPILRQYLEEGGAELGKARRAEVDAELERMGKQVVTLVVSVSEADADVIVDGERHLELKSPIATTVLVNAGSWSVTAKKAGFEPAVTRFTVGSGESRSVKLTMTPVKSEPVIAPAPSAPAGQESPSSGAPSGGATTVAPPTQAMPTPNEPPANEVSTATWIGVAATGVLAVGAGVTGALSLGAKSDLDAEVARFGTTPERVDDARQRTKTLALTTDVLAGAAIVAGAITVVLYVTDRTSTAKAADLASGRIRF